MNTFIVIMSILFFLVLLFIALFLFAIWRGILGKSSVDLQLSTTMKMVGTKMETLSGNLDRNVNQNHDIGKQLKEVARNIKESYDASKK